MEGPEAQKSTCGAPTLLGRATPSLLAVDHPNRLILSQTDVFWPKNHYIYDLRGFSRGGRHRNTETWKRRLQQRRLEGETPPELPTEGSPPSPTSSSSSPWSRGSSPPLDYGFVAVAWSISLMFFIVRSAIWAAQHDYGHIWNTYVVDLYSMIWCYDIWLYFV